MALDAYGFAVASRHVAVTHQSGSIHLHCDDLIGGVSVLLGMVTASGSALLILFTLLGYVQHPQRS
jgi:hypothetical protein